jgi:hypothetical protein
MTEQDFVRRLLDYDDKVPAAVDPDRIVAMARSTRTRRRMWLAGGLVAVVVSVVGVGIRAHVLDRGSTGSDPSAHGDVDKALAALRKAGTPVVVVDTSATGWRAVVYVSKDDSVCGGAVSDVDGRVSLSCWGSLSDRPDDRWLGRPAFQALPSPFENGNRVLVIGLMRCDADAVSIDFLGRTTAGHVVSLRALGGPGRFLAAYTAWLPIGNATAYGTADIASIDVTSGGHAAACGQR